MLRSINSLFKYTYLHLWETRVLQGSSVRYRIWAIKRLFLRLIFGFEVSSKLLFPDDIVIQNGLGTFFMPRMTDFVTTMNTTKTESNLVDFFRVPEGTIFLDIGANAGKYTVFVCKQSSLNRAYSFEPTPSTYSVFQKNIELNNIGQQVVSLNVAVGGQEGETTFAQHSGKTGLNCVVQSDKSQNLEDF